MPIDVLDVLAELLLALLGLSLRLWLSATFQTTSLKFSLSRLSCDSLEDAFKRKDNSEQAVQVLTQTLFPGHLATSVTLALIDVSQWEVGMNHLRLAKIWALRSCQSQGSLGELEVEAGLGECQYSAVPPSLPVLLAPTRSSFSSS